MLMTAPLAPHISEEMWQRLGHSESLAHGPFPVADPALLVAERGRVPDPGEGQGARPGSRSPRMRRSPRCEAAALAEPRIVELLAGAAPRKVVVVPGKMVSIVP